MPGLLDVYRVMLFFTHQHASTVSFRVHQMELCDTFLSDAVVSWRYHQKQRHNGSRTIISKLMRWQPNGCDASVNSDARDVLHCRKQQLCACDECNNTIGCWFSLFGNGMGKWLAVSGAGSLHLKWSNSCELYNYSKFCLNGSSGEKIRYAQVGQSGSELILFQRLGHNVEKDLRLSGFLLTLGTVCSPVLLGPRRG